MKIMKYYFIVNYILLKKLEIFNFVVDLIRNCRVRLKFDSIVYFFFV